MESPDRMSEKAAEIYLDMDRWKRVLREERKGEGKIPLERPTDAYPLKMNFGSHSQNSLVPIRNLTTPMRPSDLGWDEQRRDAHPLSSHVGSWDGGCSPAS